MRAAIALSTLGVTQLNSRAKVSASKDGQLIDVRWGLASANGRLAILNELDYIARQPIELPNSGTVTTLSLNGVVTEQICVQANDTIVIRRQPRSPTQIYYWIGPDTLEIDHDLDRLAASLRSITCLDRSSLLHFIWRGRPITGRTLYEGIRSLRVGEELVCEPMRRPIIRRFWWPLHSEPLHHDGEILRKEALGRLEAAVVRDATLPKISNFEKHQLSRTALLLSGGVDSSFIAAIAHRNNIPVNAFTVSFKDSYGLNEFTFASHVARLLRMPHQEVRIDEDDAKRHLAIVLSSSHPRAVIASITQSALLEAIAHHGHTHLLSGLGADECFGGYHKPLEYLAGQLQHMTKRHMDLSGLFNMPLAKLLRMRAALFLGIAEFFPLRKLSRIASETPEIHDLVDGDITFYREALVAKPFANPLELMAAHEYQYRLSELLLPAFETNALNSKPTISYPFLDPTVFLWASALDPGLCYWEKDGAWWAKRLLRETAKAFLPPKIIMRKRQILLAPIGHWLLVRSFRKIFIEEIADSYFWKLRILRTTARSQLLKCLQQYREINTDNAWQEQLWVILVLCAWTNRRETNLIRTDTPVGYD